MTVLRVPSLLVQGAQIRRRESRATIWFSDGENVDNLLVRIHFIIVMIGWTGLAPWEFEFHFPGSLTSAVPARWILQVC